MQELVTVQDEQLEGFEEAILTLKNKEKQLLEDVTNKQVFIYKILFDFIIPFEK